MNLRTKNLKFLAYLLLPAVFIACGDDDGTTTSDDDGGSTVTECDVEGEEEQSTETEIEAMRTAMVAFRDSLESEGLIEDAGGSQCLDDDAFLTWTNTPNTDGTTRGDGIIYSQMSDDTLAEFKSMLELFLSTDGYEQVQTITEVAEEWLEGTDENLTQWSPDYYTVDLFGDPESSGSWGFQLDGHHCAINFLVSGDSVSMVPAFLAGEPAQWNATIDDAITDEDARNKLPNNSSSYDYNIFESEKAALIALYDGMSDTEKANFVSDSDDYQSLQYGAPSEGDTDEYAGDTSYDTFATGFTYSDMSGTSQANLETLMRVHVENLTDTFAAEWWSDVESELANTYFQIVTVGGDTPGTESRFYYRIYNPYLFVEFNTEESTGANSSTVANWNHVHSITRIPSSPSEVEGDYGVFASMMKNGPKTLIEHYLMADHHADSKLNFDYKLSEELKQQILKNAGHSHSHGHSHRG